MPDRAQWLHNLGTASPAFAVDGLVPVKGYMRAGRPPEEVVLMEKAAHYGADAVFFEAGRNGRPHVAQAFIFISDGPADDPAFAQLHQRLWSWGQVPLLYRKTPGLIQLFRCAHKPDFVNAAGQVVCRPVKVLANASKISRDPWWDATQLRNGTLWDDPRAAKELLSSGKAAHKQLIDGVKRLDSELNKEGILRPHLRRKLLILSLLIAYLEERGVFQPQYFAQFREGARRFFEVLADGAAVVKLLTALEERFNGNVFVLTDSDRTALSTSTQLVRFARLIEGRTEANGQLTLWQLYSFKDLPVELISHIYQLFVKDAGVAVYTPPFLVRLMLDEALNWNRLDRLVEKGEVVLDPSCGSGVFLVEAYKRLVLHWRSRNDWKRPDTSVLQNLLGKVCGIDLDDGAVELAAFSLCLALCDALEPEDIRASIKLFPPLAGKTLHYSCFFDAKERGLVERPVGVVIGNPPFRSSLSTSGAVRSCDRYQKNHGSLPDKQLAYLFLHEAMEMVAPGGVLSMLQQHGFLYNGGAASFRNCFFERWNVREVLDFVSVRGLFHKGGADTKVVVVVAEAAAPQPDQKILHATFRRSGRVDAEQGFDIDYYDLHWVSRKSAVHNRAVWRANLLGGGRVLNFVTRLKDFRTLDAYATERVWNFGEGFIEGDSNVSRPADHITGHPVLPPKALTPDGIDISAITTQPDKPIEGPRSPARFTPPFLVVTKQMDLAHAIWQKNYLTYKSEIVGFAAPQTQLSELIAVDEWLTSQARPLQAFAACVSARLFTRKATSLAAADVLALPYPKTRDLDLSTNEQLIVTDIVDHYRDLVRLGEKSAAMKESAAAGLESFSSVFLKQINAIYSKRRLSALAPMMWPGVICYGFAFGKATVDWTGADDLRDKLDTLLREQQGTSLSVTRIARVYDGRAAFYLLKPDRLRYWLPSIALRDADETLADLRAQGF